jgi:hypothetical protein
MQKLSLEMKHGGFKTNPKDTTQFVMETVDIPMTQENLHVKSQMETILITFFDTKGIAHFELIPQGQKQTTKLITGKCCSGYMKLCVEKGLNFGQFWILHHHNAPAHKALSVKQFLAQKSITHVEHLPYSPDLVLNDFCFQK